MHYWQLLRPQQWIKNAFVWAGFLFARAWHDQALAQQVALAFIAFCLLASAVYIGNDWIDREADRAHPTKRGRPLASGRIGGAAAASLAIVLTVAGLAIGAWVGVALFAVLVAYLALNLLYSLLLKRIVIVDVFALSLGFLLRILAGTLGVGIAPSPWLLMCGLMLTLLLGFGKRRAETAVAGAPGREVLAEYSAALLDRLIVVCVSGTLIAYSLYTISPQTIALHGSADLVYTVPIVTYALFRYLYLLGDGHAAEDPSGLFVGDRHLQASAFAWLVAVVWILR
ncbi:MAG TPA: decaprenyl-phosphate phosphoribosyltransferase [Casimicrobiaceae bacterium]|jgi:4-hydroxybenzoate polyprenyltransferase|nr:decaprenyl-phosphate phosphoribosyltransferase [Casimicrobiaceae bacterium]